MPDPDSVHLANVPDLPEDLSGERITTGYGAANSAEKGSFARALKANDGCGAPLARTAAKSGSRPDF